MFNEERAIPVAATAFLLLALTLSGCDGSNKMDDANAGVQIQNSTLVTVTATLDGPSFSPHSETIGAGASKAVEFPAVEGDTITLDVKGAGMADGGGSCRISAETVESDFLIYAQFTIVPPTVAGGEPTVICSSGWQ